MALIRCNECGKMVSDNARICPNCGNNMKKQKKKEKEIQDQELFTTIVCTKCYKRVNKFARKCPYCGEDLKMAKSINRQVNIIAFVVLAIIVIGVVLLIANTPESNESKEESLKYQQCYSLSDTYYKCTWSTWENRCVCKAR